MPLAPGGKYRVKTTSSGKKTRLHFNKAGKVDEAKGMKNVMADHFKKKRFGKKGK